MLAKPLWPLVTQPKLLALPWPMLLLTLVTLPRPPLTLLLLLPQLLLLLFLLPSNLPAFLV